MRSRLALGALAAVVALAAASSRRGAAADDPIARFKADLARLLDRYNDDAASGRLDQGIALSCSRLAIEPSDVRARVELARFKLAKDDFDGALAEAETARKNARDAKSDDAKEAQVIAFTALLASTEQKLQTETDRAKAQAFEQKVTAESDALAAVVGGDEAAAAIVAKEQGRVAKLKALAEVGGVPPAIAKTDTAGKAITLDSYAGKVLLIDFWATWCGPCVGELPNVIATYEKWHARGFEVLGVSLDKERAALDAFLTEKKVPWRQHFDGQGWDNEIAKAWEIHAIPKTYLLDHTGRIRFVDVRGAELEKAVAELVERAAKAARPGK